jgi:hypothetical protein
MPGLHVRAVLESQFELHAAKTSIKGGIVPKYVIEHEIPP